jgi:hypothetical protein
MKPARKTSVRPLDLGLRRAVLDSQNDVQIHESLIGD